MKNDFFKFPSTPHLGLLGENSVRDDKVLSITERDEFLKHELIIEEKIDGANLGISFDSAGNIQIQNRGTYLQQPFFGQWSKLSEWLNSKTNSLFEQLTDQYILFGEWCYAKHSIFYDRLPDWFLGFDIYDKNSNKFLPVAKRDAILYELNISQVPEIEQGYFKFQDLRGLLSHSKFSSTLAEGLYLRFDNNGWLESRAKLVRPEFIQSMEHHWSRSDIKRNKLKSETIV